MLKLVKRPKSPFYYARGTINGQRVEESTGTDNLREARRKLQDIERRILSADPVSEEAELTFAAALAIYRETKPKARFLDPLLSHFGARAVSEINNAAMREAAKKLYPDASDETIRRQLYTPVKAILNHAADEELCAPPRLKIKVQANRRTVFFKPEEVDAVLLSLNANPNAYLGPLVTFLIGQGSRMKETLTLDGRDVHLDDRLAILRLTKNGEERRVSLIPRVVAAMSNLPTIGEPGPVFRRLDGHPFKTDEAAGGQIKSAFRTAVKSAHLDERRYTPHVCRHTWATWFYAQTNDVRRLQVEGGWLSNEWQRYTKIGTPDLGRRVKRFGWDFSQKLGENLGERKADVI